FRYSGQEDIAVGTPIANRPLQETEAVIGFFINTLVLRSDLSGEPSFKQLLERVRTMALGAYAHQDVPFEQVVEALQPERDRSRSPLFQVFFALQNTPQISVEQTHLHIEEFAFEQSSAQFELRMGLTQNARGLETVLEYNTDLFEAATIQRLLGHWQTLLEGIVARPDRLLWQLPLLSQAEQDQVLHGWNATRVDYPADLCVHQLVELQVQRTPDAIALVCGEDQLSYAQLDQRANQLAHALQQQGVGPEVLVGICLERSPLLLIALLAVLKAGGAYVPLDPTYPEQRLRFMVQQSQPRVLLTQQTLRSSLAWPEVERTWCLEHEWSWIAALPTTAAEGLRQGEQAAYVIYTSGSTGEPKGVVISHASLLNFLLAMREQLALRPQDCWAAVTSISFDIAALELYLPLLVGARIGLVTRSQAGDGSQLCQLLGNWQVRVMQATPATWTLLLAAGWEGLQTLVALCGGEALPQKLAQRVQAVSGSLLNLYGPTETTIWSSVAVLQGQEATVSIGRPLANTQCYVLDGHQQPVPIGVAGELYIGGAGVARGYLERGAQTAERFVPDGWGQQMGGRLYRTGDVVRYGSDGRLEYLGREDGQVKLRGYRIELGEIETVLDQHEQVQQSVVVLQGEQEHRQLVAYVVRQSEQAGAQLTATALRGWLKENVPDYMIPGQMVFVQEFPHTANGKVDRRRLGSLPWPTESVGQTQEGRQLETPLQELVAQTWKQVLQIEQVRAQDQFFEIGGHSLLATRVVARLRRLLGVEVPLQVLFEAPTLVDLTERLQLLLRQEQESSVPAIVPVPRDQELPLSFAQQRLWFLDQLEPGSTAYTIPGAMRLQGRLNRAAFDRALIMIMQRHETLRTTFPVREGQPIQLIAAEPITQLIILDLSALPQQEHEIVAQQLVQQEAKQPFDLVHGPLLRCSLIQLAPEHQILLLSLHHIISDGWSSGILLRELVKSYTSLQQGEAVALPELPVQYADYALWQREWLQGAVLQQQLDYWKQNLAGLQSLELPTDHPRPAIQTYQGALMHRWLSVELKQRVHALSQRAGVTSFMTLLAAFQVLLARYSGQYDIAVGTPIANRRREEIEDLIGFFANTQVLRTDLSGNPSFIDLLERVRVVALGAYMHQDVPFEQVVEAVQPQRDLSRTPLFQVMFSTQPALLTVESPDGLVASAINADSTISKFDLTLNVMEDTKGLYCEIEYNTDLFETTTIQRLLDHWQRLLEDILSEPEQHIAELEFLSEEERQKLLIDWDAPQSKISGPLCLHTLFEEQVVNAPDAVALVYEDTQLTYAQLNTRANQLAHYLIKMGVKPEVLVGICMERSLELVVCLLGILKAGGGYVPLSASYPAERLAFMLKDASVSVLLTQEHIMHRLSIQNTGVVCIDSAWKQIACESQETPSLTIFPDNVAYVIYTSGSTGTPKGVAVSHSSLVSAYCSWEQAYRLKQQSTVHLQMANFSFDVFSGDLTRALCSGGKLVLCPPELLLEAAQLHTLMRREYIDTAEFVPAVLRNLLTYLQKSKQSLSFMQTVIVGSDIWYGKEYQDVKDLCGQQTRLINSYGVTEATIDSAYFDAELLKEIGEGVVPIGRSFSNTRLYILDKHLHLVPIGVVGELYIGGEGVTRGYLYRPEITAEAFIPDPFSNIPGARMYRSGDIARRLFSGDLEYVGRRDAQIKLRGYRIELGEIEASLSQHPLVEQCVVIWQSEEKQLVAYVSVGKGESSIQGSHSELRRFLKEKLPDYLIPTYFVTLDSLPLTPNGKVDRQRLPPPHWEERNVPESMGGGSFLSSV
ncbi:MAG TPA: amino acid adenylation domain-containing protein, partial [Ktedonobacteraceae bacterium]|nr:amino acid adenylation domain-containing protein [Ktedonobacteraceae bacterium]